MRTQDLEGQDASDFGLDVQSVQASCDGDRRASCIPRPNDGMLSPIVGLVEPLDETVGDNGEKGSRVCLRQRLDSSGLG
jgi:hypothetical protein